MSLRFVKVTAKLNSPLAGDPPMLDSICEVAMCGLMLSVQETDRTGRHTFPIVPAGQEVPLQDLGKIPIPIARDVIDGLPIPRASAPIIPVPKHDTHGYYHKKFEVEHASLLKPKERTKITASGGRFKSFRLPLRLRTIDRVVWFAAIKQSPSELRKLLKKRVQAIGKKTSFGYGRIKAWIVESCDSDCSWFADSEDGLVLMRPLPLGSHLPKNLVGSRPDFGAVCGPYWQQNLWRERVVPC